MAITTTVKYGDFYFLKRLMAFTNSSSRWYITNNSDRCYTQTSPNGAKVGDWNLTSSTPFSFNVPTIGDKDIVYLKGYYHQSYESSATSIPNLKYISNNGKSITIDNTSVGSLQGETNDFSFDITSLVKKYSGKTATFYFNALLGTKSEYGSGANQSEFLTMTYEIDNLRLEIVKSSGTCRRWNGSGWEICEVYRYNGTKWESCELYRINSDGKKELCE